MACINITLLTNCNKCDILVIAVGISDRLQNQVSQPCQRGADTCEAVRRTTSAVI